MQLKVGGRTVNVSESAEVTGSVIFTRNRYSPGGKDLGI